MQFICNKYFLSVIKNVQMNILLNLKIIFTYLINIKIILFKNTIWISLKFL